MFGRDALFVMTNNYDLTTDTFNTHYKRYKRTMPWKDFKRAGWIRGQVLCEKYDFIITGHKTKSEKFWYLIDKLIAYIRKGKKKKGSKKKMSLFGKSNRKGPSIFPTEREMRSPKRKNKIKIFSDKQPPSIFSKKKRTSIF